MARTPADQLDYLVREGAMRFTETFLRLMKYEAQGGRTPGLVVPSKAELKALFESTTPGYWQTIARHDPQEAETQLRQWESIQ